MSNTSGFTAVEVVDYTPSFNQEDKCNGISNARCICSLCMGELPNGYVLVSQKILDRFRVCFRCGFVWKKASDEPDKCPGCGSYRWSIPVENECIVCGNRWLSCDGAKSHKCPSCCSREGSASDDIIGEIAVETQTTDNAPAPEDRANYYLDFDDDEEMQAAVLRCINGFGLYKTAVDFSVPLLDLINILDSEGIEFRIR